MTADQPAPSVRETAYVSVSTTGFVDGACFTDDQDEVARWIAEMGAQGMCVIETDKVAAKSLLFTTLSASDGKAPQYGRMLVARRENGEVEAAGWDCASTRKSARDWLSRGLTLEMVPVDRVACLAAVNPLHVFATLTPAGDVLTERQAREALARF